MSFNLSPIINTQQVDSNGAPLSGGLIYTYLANSSTLAPTYNGITGAISQSNPIVLTTLGAPTNPAWLDASLVYKFVIQNSLGVVQRTIDNVSGISSSVPVQDQWTVYGGVPTYINATSFSVAGDQTAVFQVARRVRTTNTGGVVYSSVVSAVFGAVTTVTLVNDSGVLDAGLSQASYGLLTPINASVPSTYAKNSYVNSTGVETLTTTGSAGTYVLTSLRPQDFPTFSLATGMRFRVLFNVAGLAVNTLNVNGSGAKSVVSYGIGGSFNAPINTGVIYDAHYDGSSFVVLNPVQYDYTGEYFWWPMNSTPIHGLICNGAAISRTTYARLFAVLGTFYGVGDGSTTFNLPNVTSGYTLTHVPASEGTTSTGQVIAHTHLVQSPSNGVNTVTGGPSGIAAPGSNIQTGSTGGSANLAAAVYARLCLRF